MSVVTKAASILWNQHPHDDPKGDIVQSSSSHYT